MEIDRRRLQDEAYRSEVLTALLQNYQDRVFRYCVTRLGEVQGEEIAQEVFLTAWQSLPKFRQDSAIETWLVGIAKYKCVQAFRNRTRRRDIAHAFMDEIRQRAHVESPEGPERVAAAQGEFTHLAHCMTQLRDDERILLNLRYTKDLSIPDIADIVGKSEAAVRKRILRALQRLRTLVDEEGA